MVVEDIRELGADLVGSVEVSSRDCDPTTTADAAARTVLSLMLLLLVKVCESVWIEVLTIAAFTFDPGGGGRWWSCDCCGVGSAVIRETHRGDGSGTAKEVVVFLRDTLRGFEGCRAGRGREVLRDGEV